jgi:hypothetical protein
LKSLFTDTAAGAAGGAAASGGLAAIPGAIAGAGINTGSKLIRLGAGVNELVNPFSDHNKSLSEGAAARTSAAASNTAHSNSMDQIAKTRGYGNMSQLVADIKAGKAPAVTNEERQKAGLRPVNIPATKPAAPAIPPTPAAPTTTPAATAPSVTPQVEKSPLTPKPTQATTPTVLNPRPSIAPITQSTVNKPVPSVLNSSNQATTTPSFNGKSNQPPTTGMASARPSFDHELGKQHGFRQGYGFASPEKENAYNQAYGQKYKTT